MLDALLFAKTPSLLTAVYSDCLWEIATDEPVIYLTFDDGPQPGATSFVLEQLKGYDAKATFFCIGKNMVQHPELVQQTIDEGHTVSNHTYDHISGWKMKDADYFKGIELCAEVLEKFGAVNKFFRPPYGKLKPSQYKKLKEQFHIVMWNVLSYDFSPNVSSERVWWNVMQNTAQGSIVVFHDSQKALPHLEKVLPKTLDYFSKRGFRFKSLV